MGALVGVSELVSRYRDEPGKAVFESFPAWFYLLLNASASILALYFARLYGWKFGATDPTAIRVTQILAAGFGAMALFRTSLFVVRVGREDVGIGPSSILTIVLQAVDRAVDRRRAEVRDDFVAGLMKTVDFEKAFEALPAHCIALMQNLSEQDQQAFARQVKDIRSSQAPPRAKSYLLGLALLNLVGEDVLKSAVNTLGDEIRQK